MYNTPLERQTYGELKGLRDSLLRDWCKEDKPSKESSRLAKKIQTIEHLMDKVLTA